MIQKKKGKKATDTRENEIVKQLTLPIEATTPSTSKKYDVAKFLSNSILRHFHSEKTIKLFVFVLKKKTDSPF